MNETRETASPHFALCLDDEGHGASLEIGKLYRVVAEAPGYIRVVDESGEDYALSANRFYRLELPQPVEEALLSVSRS